jgi:integrase
MLTDTAIRNLKAGDKATKHFDGGGLYLLVQPSGGRLWRFKYRMAGKEKLISLGAYPEVGLKEARKRRDDAREKVAGGVDPSQARQDEKRAQRIAAGNSFQSVAERWFKQWRGARTQRTADEVWKRLEADVFPEIGHVPVQDLTAARLLQVAAKIQERGAVELGIRQFQKCSQILRYAVGHELCERNPAADVNPADVLQQRTKRNHARLEAREMPELLGKIEAYDGSILTRYAMQLMALTFVRTSELIGARWEEFDFKAKQWRIPAERMKMKTPHIVPLASQAIDILKSLQKLDRGSEYVFPSERTIEKPMSNNTILFALYRMGYHSRMTGHGFRGVASTILHEMGFRHDLIELQLAHQERDEVSAAYNFATYIPQRTEMMQAWADTLDRLRDEKGGDELT